MGQGNKKRKLEDGDQASWTKEKAAAFVKDVEEVQKALKHCDINVFANRLAESLDEASMDTIEVVKKLVSPILLDGYKDAKHCVRCHKTYTEEDNHGSACVILCSGKFHAFGRTISPEQSHFMTKCCGRVYKYGAGCNPTVLLVCVEERHTDDPAEVVFFDPNRGQDAVDKGPVLVETNNPLVLTCEAKGCLKQT